MADIIDLGERRKSHFISRKKFNDSQKIIKCLINIKVISENMRSLLIELADIAPEMGNPIKDVPEIFDKLNLHIDYYLKQTLMNSPL